jgi:peroxiredoxin (alkyl hydroperoxide reductase subunit C)
MSATSVFSSPVSLVGRKAPEFIAPAVMKDGSIVEDASLTSLLNGSYGVIVFYPLDFTFVCPTELVALDRQLSEFAALNAKVITVSVDSQYTHAAWRRQSVVDGGIGEVSYPMVSDLSHSICESYGVKASNASVALRATFILDQNGIVQSQIVNNLPIGRNINEFIRVLQSLQYFEKHGEVCPVNWQNGDSGMSATQEGVKRYLERVVSE